MDGRSVKHTGFFHRHVVWAVVVAAVMPWGGVCAWGQAMGKATVDGAVGGEVLPEVTLPEPPVKMVKSDTGGGAEKRAAAATESIQSPAPTPAKVVAASPPVVVKESAREPVAARPSSPADQLPEGQLDLRIVGDGYFCLRSSDNTAPPLYTRVGHFRVTDTGLIALVQLEKYVLNPPITLPAGVTSLSIDSDGMVRAQLKYVVDKQSLGVIQVAKFANPGGMRPVGNLLYEATDTSGAAEMYSPGNSGVGTLIQGQLETNEVAAIVPAVTAPVVASAPALDPARVAPAAVPVAPPVAAAAAHVVADPIESRPIRAARPTEVVKDEPKGDAVVVVKSGSGLTGGLGNMGQVGAALAIVVGLILIGRALVKKFVPGAKTAGGKG